MNPVSPRVHRPSHAVGSREADRCQADYFRAELHRQIELLNGQADVLRAKLATHLRRNQPNQVRRTQYELRMAAIERRELTDMLALLGQRFPSGDSRADNTGTGLSATPKRSHTLAGAPGGLFTVMLLCLWATATR